MAQSKKYTIQIERVLKEYPYICWRINNQQSSLNKELKQMGIRKESIEFLKNIFFQNSDIKKFYDCEQELYYLTEIKKIIDIALERLEAYPKKGKQLYDIINAIYLKYSVRIWRMQMKEHLVSQLSKVDVKRQLS